MSSSRLELVIDSRQAERELRQLQGRLDGVERAGTQAQSSASGLSRELGGLRTVALAASGAFAAMGITSLGRDVFNTVASVEKMRASLVTVTGSIDSANAAWDQMREFAKTTPFELDQSVQAFIRMKALGLDPTEEALRSFANTSAAMGTDLMQMVEAVADATTGEFERLKEYGIRASQDGERVALTFQGTTTTIGNNAKEIQSYLENIGNTNFADAAIDQMDTLSGKANNLSDSVTDLYLAIGAAGATDIFNAALDGSADAVEFLNNNVETLARGVDLLADAALIAGGIFGARMVSAMAAGTAATLNSISVTRAHTLALAENQAADLGRIATLARSVAEEKAAAAASAQVAAQRAALARAAIAQDAQRMASTQAALAAERALETQRLQAQISAQGRMMAATRLAEIRVSETAITNQLTAANVRLTEAEAAETAATRAAAAASADKARADTAATAAMGRYTGAVATASTANTAFAATSRAAAGALALVGGPVGAAVIAGAGLYYFREELGLTDSKMQGTVDNVEELGSAFIEEFGNLGSEIVGAFRGIRAELVELDAGFLDMKAGALESFTDIIAGSADLINMGLIPIQHALNALDQGFADWINRFANAFESAGDMPFGMANLFGEQVTRMRAMADSLTEGMIEPIGISTTALENNAQAWRDQAEAMRGSAEDIRNGVNPAAKAALDIFKPLSEWLFETNDALNEPVDSEAAKAAKKLADEFESLKRQLDPSYSSLMDFWEGIELLNKAIDTNTIEGMAEYNHLVGLLTERYAEATKGSDETRKRVEALTQQYDRQYQRGVSLTTAINDINAAYRRGDIDGQQYTRMIAGVRDEMRELALESDPVAQEMARAWEEASNRIDETFSDAFAGAFDSFESFSDQLMDGFKRLLAELAYQATLKPIVVAFTGDMQGLMSGGGGGFGNTIGAARSLFSSGSSLIGGGSTAAAAGGLYSGASTGLAAGGLYGNAVTGGIASTGIMSSITAGVSAAMPWIAGGLAIDSLLGGGITKAISGLFGGGKTNPHLIVDTRASNNYGHGSVREGAFGAVGFGQGTRRSNDLFGGIDKEREFLAAVAASDDLLAGLARSPAELNRMAEAVQGVRLSASSVDGIMAQLSNRTVAAVSALDGEFGEFVGSLGTDVDTIIARTQSAVAAMNLMGAASENLNLQFDASASGALRAADSIAQLAGGVDQLATLQDSYYQAYFSDAERAANLQRELTQALAEMGYALPSTRDGFRALVEQQNQLTESGQRNYVQLLQLAGAFDQMQTMLANAGSAIDSVAGKIAELTESISGLEDDVRRAYQAFERQSFDLQVGLLELMGDKQSALALQRERELQSIDPLLHDMQRRFWALQDEAEAQQKATQAAQQYISELSRIRDQLNSSIGSINQWIDQRTATSGTPGMNLTAAGEQFARQLVLAESGDRNALQSITQYADQYLAAGEQMFASGSGFQRIQEDVLSSLKGLPEALSDAEYIVDGFRDIVSNEMAREIERAIFSSQYKIDTLIEFAADASKLPEDLRTILGEQAHRLDSTLNYLLGENQLDNELRRLALESTNNLVSTVDYITGFELSDTDKLLALSSSNRMTAVIDYVIGTDIGRDSRILALEESNRYSAIVDMILGRDISETDRRLALESINSFTSVIDYVIRSPLTGGDRRLALAGNNSYEALIGYYVDRDVSQADRELALASGNRYLANIEYFVGRDISSADRRLALSSNNRYVSVIDQIIGEQITGGDRRLALNSTNSYLTTVDAILENGIAADVRTFGLANSNSIMTTVDGILASRLPSDVRTLALEDSNRFVTTLEAALADGRLTGDERKLLDAKSERVVKTLVTSGGLNLKPEQLAVINAASGTRRLELLADVAFGRTDLDELSKIEGNTKSLEERALEQLGELNSLVDEMSSTASQFVQLNSTMLSLDGSITALVNAQQTLINMQERANQVASGQQSVSNYLSRSQRHASTAEMLSGRIDPRNAGNIERLIDRRMDDGQFTHREWEQMLAHLENTFGRNSNEYLFGREYAAMYRTQTRADEEQSRIPGFADGGYTGPGGRFEPAGIVHAGEIVWSQGDIARFGGVSAVESLRTGMQAPPIPALPLLGMNDVTQVMRDMQRTIERQGQQLAELLRAGNRNTEQTRDAVVGVGEDAHRQREQHNRQLDRLNRNAKEKVRI